MHFSYSLIICCYNSSLVIEPTIEAICSLECDTEDDIELIVVDNNCTDTTIEQLSSVWSSEFIDLKVVPESVPGLMHARRKGVACATREVVVFIDDDNILDKKWLQILDSVYKENIDVACVGGRVSPVVNDVYPWWFKNFEGVYACGKQANESMVVSQTRMTLFGAGLSFRNEVIQNIFNQSNELYLTGRTGNKLLRGDDSELCMRCLLLGYNVYYSDEMHLTHNILPERVTWDYVQKARFGGGMADIILSLYRSINMGDKPKSYFKVVLSVMKRWLLFIINPENIVRGNKEGMLASFEYHYLKGLTSGLFLFPPKRYNDIRNNLLQIKHECNKYK